MSSVGWSELVSRRQAPRTALVLLGIWLNAADSLVTSTIMPSVARDLGGYAWFGWAVAIYLLGAILAAASAGQLAHRLGLARAISLAALVYAAGCALGAVSPNITLFVAGRLGQGLGGGWVSGFCYVAISQLFEERLWARVFGAAAGVWGVASFLGPLVGGAFAEAGFWRGAFWVFAVSGVMLAAAAPWLLGAEHRKGNDEAARRPLAWRTLAVLSLAIIAIAAADVTEGAGRSLGLLAIGLALMFAAGWVNARPSERLLPLEALRPGTRAGAGYAFIFFMMAASAVFGVYGAAILQSVARLTPLAAGYVVASDAVGWTLTAIIVSGQPDRRHPAFILAGAVTINIGLVLLAWLIGGRAAWAVFIAGFVFGAGYGLAWSLATRRILAALPTEDRAIGASASPTTQMIGSAAGAALAGAIANLLGLAHAFTPERAAASAPWLFAAFLPLSLIGLAAAARLARVAGPSGVGVRSGRLGFGGQEHHEEGQRREQHQDRADDDQCVLVSRDGEHDARPN
ncbi:MAG TPA: MFS transporter [Caulobacteraceae bacterium]|jgi:MFS family permease